MSSNWQCVCLNVFGNQMYLVTFLSLLMSWNEGTSYTPWYIRFLKYSRTVYFEILKIRPQGESSKNTKILPWRRAEADNVFISISVTLKMSLPALPSFFQCLNGADTNHFMEVKPMWNFICRNAYAIIKK